MEYRVENKYLVSDADLKILEARIKAVMQPDVHQIGECYEIRSMYFDDIVDSCMNENESGIDLRKKYRVRYYGVTPDVLHLEIKEKTNGYTQKKSCDISEEECKQIISGNTVFHIDDRKPWNQLQLQMRGAGMKPKVIIDYERTAYVHPTGNVRITFDRNISASRYCDAFLEECIPGKVPVLPKGRHVLEVKYDELLPDFIAKQLEIGSLQKTAFSKYYLGRLAVQGEIPII